MAAEPLVTYRGRFAPSPTGRLHFGSLVAAIASYCDAKSNDGDWLLRIEDLDPPRIVPGSSDDIIKTLEGFGFEWDGEILYQSQRLNRYKSALENISQIIPETTYQCGCTRKELAAIYGLAYYPGICREGLKNGKLGRSIRFKVSNNANVLWEDVIQGVQVFKKEEISDFIIRRGDGLFAYHLAVVVDDYDFGITHIVRGRDLLTSTPAHLLLQSSLRLDKPIYAHLPIAKNSLDLKLGKNTLANPVEIKDADKIIADVLLFLGQDEVELSLPSKMLSQAISQWDITKIPRRSDSIWS
jgi:glutamyl-Q tRNA(Asp) synthetase